jgi:hypothetical protein
MTTPNGRTLLSEATAETLREDAAELRLIVRDMGWTISGGFGQRLLRLAELAEAVAEAEDRSLDLRAVAVPLMDDADVAWEVIEHHMGEPRERVVSEYNRSLPAALSQLLPTTGDGQ